MLFVNNTGQENCYFGRRMNGPFEIFAWFSQEMAISCLIKKYKKDLDLLEFWIAISQIIIDFSLTRHVNKQQSVKSKAIEFSIQQCYYTMLFTAGNVNNYEPSTRIKCKFKDKTP